LIGLVIVLTGWDVTRGGGTICSVTVYVPDLRSRGQPTIRAFSDNFRSDSGAHFDGKYELETFDIVIVRFCKLSCWIAESYLATNKAG